MKKVNFLFTSLLIFFLLTDIHSRAQAPQNTLGSVTIASPTAASLGKFGDIPVSYHTGVPKIDIPIYTIEAGPLKLPIGLSYHASGVKVMEPAGWAGSGWALNAGGVITRTINGQPDEAGTNSGGQMDGHFSNNGYNSYLYSGTQQDWLNFANGNKDGEPDFFFFNFGGYSGKFYFRDDRTPVLVPQQDLSIIPSYSGGRSIDYFTIVTPDGTRYIFGNSPNVLTGAVPIEITNSYTQNNGANLAPPTSAWFLNQVVSADNAFAINLTYQAENYGYYTIAMFPIDHTGTGPDGQYGYNLVKNIMKGVRLSQISFPNGTVNFSANNVRTDLCDTVQLISEGSNTSAKSLDSIQITDGNGYCKTFKFYYTYFTATATALPNSLTWGFTYATDLKRLRLDSVKENSCDGTLKVPPYKFTYYTGTVPRRLSFGVDHWGYYNGADSNTKLIPTIYVNGGSVPGALRDAAWPAMEAGIMTRIDYPTGGYTNFDFESNTGLVAQTTVSTNVLAQFQFAGPIFHQQNTTYSGSVSCTSNGDAPVTLKIQTNCNWGGWFEILDASNNVFFQTSFNNTTGAPGTDGGVTTQTTVYTQTLPTTFMPAGSYTIKAWLTNGNQTPVGGVYIIISQPSSVTTYVPTTLGGLRIKTITSNDGLTANNIVTNYSYTTPAGSQTAVLYSIPTYALQIRNDLLATIGYWTADSGYKSTILNTFGCPNVGYYLTSPGTIRPMNALQGAPIGYQMVTVSQPGNGSSVYTYYTSNNGWTTFANVQANNTVNTSSCDPTVPNYPDAPLPFDSKRGELYSEQHYDNSGRLLKDIYYEPFFNESPILSTPAFMVKQRNIGGGTYYLGTLYSLNTVKKIGMLSIQDDYGTSGGFVTTVKRTYYGSNFHNQPTRTVTSTSMGDSLITTTQYTADFRVANCDTISDCSATYNSACTSCQATYNTTAAGCGGSSSCLTTAYMTYMQCNTNARTAYVSCRNTNYMGPSNRFSACHLTAEASADTLLKPILRLQDEFDLSPIEVTQWRDNSLLHSSFDRYDTSISPVGFAYPGRTKLINLQAPSASFTPATVSGNTISKDSRYLDETLYQFTNGNAQQLTPHDGQTIAYVWDYLNTKPIAKATNTAASQVAYTSFEADGNGSWSIPSGTRDITTAITGGSSYNLTNGAVSRSGLSSGTAYIVSYWSKTGTSYTVTGSTGVVQGRTITINGGTWTYFEHTLTGVTSTSITGTSDIDELRLYPSNAQMTSYTYSPMIGMTSQCDADNRISYYSYDGLGRLKYIRDQDGNILKTTDYHYQGQ